MENIKNIFRDKFKKSDALTDLKELSATMTVEDFVDFSNSAMLDAYRSNRVKAVEYMLSFYEKGKPELLLRIHLARMLSYDKDCKKGKKMLVPLVKHFPKEFINEVMTTFMNQHNNLKKADFQSREKEIDEVVLKYSLNQENKKPTKKLKL